MQAKNVLLAITLCLFTFSNLQAQNWWKNRIKGEGDIEKRTIEVSDFDGFTLAVGANVKLRQGPEHEMIIEAQPNIIDNIELKYRDGHLRITYDRPVYRTKGITIYLTAPSLDKVSVSGSGNIDGEGTFKSLGDLAIAVSGSGNVNLDFEAKEIQTSVSGSGNLRLSGSGDRFSVSVSGSGNVKAGDLVVADARVSVSGSGNVHVHATENLDARVSGSGDIKYKGRPRIIAKTSGSGDIEAIQ